MGFFHYLKKLKSPKESFLGFKILSSIQSSISAYFLILIIYLIQPYFGIRNFEIFASLLFYIIAYLSVLILIFNIFLRRFELKKVYFIFLNLPLFLFAPTCVFKLIKNSKLLFIILFTN